MEPSPTAEATRLTDLVDQVLRHPGGQGIATDHDRHLLGVPRQVDRGLAGRAGYRWPRARRTPLVILTGCFSAATARPSRRFRGPPCPFRWRTPGPWMGPRVVAGRGAARRRG